MTQAQKNAQANFKKAIAYRKKSGCTLKEAFAHVKKTTIKGLDGVVKKGNKTTVLYSNTKTKKPLEKKQGTLFGVSTEKIKINFMDDIIISAKQFNGYLVMYPYGDHHNFVATSFKALKAGLKNIVWSYKPIVYLIETFRAKPNFKKLTSVQLKGIYAEL